MAVDTIHHLRIGISHSMPSHDRFSQLAQDTSLDRAKSQPVDQQGGSLPNDFVLEEKFFWRDRIVGEKFFELEKWMEPLTKTRKDGRSVIQHRQSGLFPYRHIRHFLRSVSGL